MINPLVIPFSHDNFSGGSSARLLALRCVTANGMMQRCHEPIGIGRCSFLRRSSQAVSQVFSTVVLRGFEKWTDFCRQSGAVGLGPALGKGAGWVVGVFIRTIDGDVKHSTNQPPNFFCKIRCGVSWGLLGVFSLTHCNKGTLYL